MGKGEIGFSGWPRHRQDILLLGVALMVVVVLAIGVTIKGALTGTGPELGGLTLQFGDPLPPSLQLKLDAQNTGSGSNENDGRWKLIVFAEPGCVECELELEGVETLIGRLNGKLSAAVVVKGNPGVSSPEEAAAALVHNVAPSAAALADPDAELYRLCADRAAYYENPTLAGQPIPGQLLILADPHNLVRFVAHGNGWLRSPEGAASRLLDFVLGEGAPPVDLSDTTGDAVAPDGLVRLLADGSSVRVSEITTAPLVIVTILGVSKQGVAPRSDYRLRRLSRWFNVDPAKVKFLFIWQSETPPRLDRLARGPIYRSTAVHCYAPEPKFLIEFSPQLAYANAEGLLPRSFVIKMAKKFCRM